MKAGDLISSMVAFAGYSLIMDIDSRFVNLFELDSRPPLARRGVVHLCLDINHDGVITPDEIARRIEEGGLAHRADASSRRDNGGEPLRARAPLLRQGSDGGEPLQAPDGLLRRQSGGQSPETTKPTPEPARLLVALRLGIFFVVYPAVIAYLWFYYIPTRSIRSKIATPRPKRLHVYALYKTTTAH